MTIRFSLLLNFLAAIVWASLQPVAESQNYVVGFVIGFIVLAVFQPEYGRRVGATVAFVIFLLWSIVVSSIQVAKLILSRSPPLDQGIIAIPLRAETALEIATLATAITLTPGTLSVDVKLDGDGGRTLFVHSLKLGDAEALKRDIQTEFEDRILRFTRGANRKLHLED
ncbi:MAG: Na+/H+ antiporter subunit E [Anaerolineales bacterium]|nr:Na+/H+ antiporter subunit E [Anaerolineales bacterium]